MGADITRLVYKQYSNDNPFWKKYLPYVRHVDLYYSGFKGLDNMDVSIFTHIKSLDIYDTLKSIRMTNLEKLTQLKQLFCDELVDTSKLTKINIHFHYYYSNTTGLSIQMMDDHSVCQRKHCLIS